MEVDFLLIQSNLYIMALYIAVILYIMALYIPVTLCLTVTDHFPKNHLLY